MLSRFRIGDRSLARQLVALLSVLAAALAVALPGDHRAARAFAADVAGREADVDEREAVLDALGLMLEPARVQRDRALALWRTSARPSRWPPAARPSCSAALRGSYALTRFRDRLEAGGVLRR